MSPFNQKLAKIYKLLQCEEFKWTSHHSGTFHPPLSETHHMMLVSIVAQPGQTANCYFLKLQLLLDFLQRNWAYLFIKHT